MESVTSDAEVLIELAGWQSDDRFLNELFHAPAVADPHAFRVPHRYGFVHRVADMARQNGFQRFVYSTADRSLRFGAAGIDIAVGFDRNFGAAMTVLQEIDAARTSGAEVLLQRRGGDFILNRAATRPELADP